jgi:ribosomal protein L29
VRKELSDEELREVLAEAFEKAQALLKSKSATGDSEKPPVVSPFATESDLIH